jgi:hypothetical protein
MVVNPFINILRTKQEALYFKNSQINTQFIFKGGQLLPNNPRKYIQVTNTPLGIDLEDWQVNAVDLCTGVKQILLHFFVDRLTNDLDGAPAVSIEFNRCSFDFGYNLIYLEINQLLRETFILRLMLTEIESERTTQFHYKENKDAVYQSIGLQTWYFDEDENRVNDLLRITN